MSDPPHAPTAYDAPLDGGLVVEASAGTGKTYALTTLVARLIVEARRRIDDLLIVTFTAAATGELRTRVWETLRSAADAVGGSRQVTGQARELAEHWRRSGVTHDDAAARLNRAIRDFDRANITTIHGFCQRALGEFALEAGLPFKFSVSGHGALEVQSATRDFWRGHMADAAVPLLEYAKARKFQLDEGADWVAKQLAAASTVRPAMSDAEFAREWGRRRKAWHDAFDAVRDAWADGEQRDVFDEVWDSGHYRWKVNKKKPAVYDAATAGLAANDADLVPLADAGYFGLASLTNMLYKRNPPPALPLFDHFERLGEAAEDLGEFWLVGRRRGLLTDAATTLHEHVWRERGLTFDALLTELHDALLADNGGTLAKRVRARYPIALIDEFQDTDRVQAQIFEAIYPNDGLIVVGDPKQSIYRFRGADVFAYVDARARLDHGQGQLELTQNYRSTSKLVQAVNAMFQRDNALVLPEISFEPAAAAGDAGALRVAREDYDHAPFQLHLFDAGSDGKRWRKPDLTEAAASHAADRIAELLRLARTDKAMRDDGVNEVRLAAGDIAVLVRTGQQGRTMIRELRKRGIRTVEIGTDSVFDSIEADSLHRVLHALATDEAEYDSAMRLRGALAADLFGLDMNELDRLREDDQVWAEWLERARDWRRIWADGGITALLRHLLFADDPACAGNLLKYPDGPRRLTNFLHLSDLLHDAETRDRLSRRGLLDWFAHFKARPERGGETAQLRLESDEELVKIVTVHRAKGLEFPVVFCPFAWWGRPPDKNATARYYDIDAKEPVLDLQPSLAATQREQFEEFADEMRLLYVALTRAKYRCEVTWARANQSEYAPLAWLIHGAEGDDSDANATRVKGLGATDWLDEARRISERAPQAISVHEAAPASARVTVPALDPGSDSLAARELQRGLARIRQITSYSALSSGAKAAGSGAGSAVQHDAVYEPDHDQDEPVPVEADESAVEPALDVFSFPSGSRAGNCLHEILERQADHGLDAACHAALARYGIDAKWLPVARSMVENACNTPLGSAEPAIRLADLDRPVAEMEFHLRVQSFRPGRLADILGQHGYDRRVPDDPAAINGFLHGYIDLVARHENRWYVLDYKSNWLGGRFAAYSPEAIAASMRQRGYHLQYLLYLTALHRLLEVRLPDYDYDRHVGGAYYLFLRGMRTDAPGHGVHFDRPARECIVAISRCLSGDDDA